MSYADERIIFDADSHLMELPDYLREFADPDIRDRLPKLGETATAIFDAKNYGDTGAHSPETTKKLLAMGDDITRGPKWHEALGSFNGKERNQVLDLLGFKKQVIFSSFCSRLIFDDPDFDIRYGAAAAQNRSMAEFVKHDERMIGVGMVPLDEPDRAVAEIKRVLGMGLGAVWIGSDAPGGRSPGHPDLNPVWVLLQEAGVPFILHVGSSTLSIPDPWMNDGRPARTTARGGAEVIGSKDLTVIHHSAVRFVSTMILDGVLEQFPKLKGGVIELGAGWVPDMIRRLDHAAEIWTKSEPHLAQMTRKPSEQIHDQLRFTPYPFEDVAQLVAESSPDLYLFSTDYPHAEGGRDPIGRFLRSTESLTDDHRDRFFHRNFLDIYSA